MRREDESKSLMRRNRVQHIAYSLKPTAHCCHNYYIGLLEALWDIAVNMKLSEMYLKILSIFLRRMDTQQTKRMREHRQHWCGRELCPTQNFRSQASQPAKRCREHFAPPEFWAGFLLQKGRPEPSGKHTFDQTKAGYGK